ncbi:Uncharacterised protein [Bordetella pertussis]|nr:Uncharacterised protein [Bordetella pertussis]
MACLCSQCGVQFSFCAAALRRSRNASSTLTPRVVLAMGCVLPEIRWPA